MTDIDFAGVVSQLQDENERLRLQLLKLHYRRSFDLAGILSYCEKNPLKMSLVAIVVWFVLECLATIVGLFRGKEYA